MKRSLILIVFLATFTCAFSKDVYINKAWHYDSGEFYVFVQFKPNYSWNDHEFLLKKLKAPSNHNGQIHRRTLPDAVAKQYFDLSGFETIILYDDVSYQPLGRMRFKEVAYLGGGPVSNYIAVFEVNGYVPKTTHNGNYFCIGQLPGDNDRIGVIPVPISSGNAVQYLRSRYGFHEDALIYSGSWHIGEETLSIVSWFGPKGKPRSLLLAAQNGAYTSLLELEGSKTMMGLMLTPLVSNGRRVIIMDMAVPNTGLAWEQTACFDGEQYNFSGKGHIVDVRP